jgi:hypothetical protein
MRSVTSLRTYRGHGWVALRCSAVVVVLGLAGGCAGSSTPTSTAAPEPTASASKIISAAALRPGQSIPAPTQTLVLTVTGKISAVNRGRALLFDKRTIEQLGVVQVRLFEPWTKENLEFRGVWLQDLLAVSGVAADATRLHIVALDDYAVDLTLAEIRVGGIMLATRAGDGSSIPIDKGGPTRIVFQDGVKTGANPDKWVWSVKTIDVL